MPRQAPAGPSSRPPTLGARLHTVRLSGISGQTCWVPGTKLKAICCVWIVLCCYGFTPRVLLRCVQRVCVCVFAFNNETRLMPFCLFERLRSHTPPGRCEPREPSDTQPPRRVSLTTQEQRRHSITVSCILFQADKVLSKRIILADERSLYLVVAG